MKAVAFIGPSSTKGAIIPRRRRPATKVIVFQCPCGTWSVNRMRRGQRPRSRTMAVLVEVSSINNSMAGDVLEVRHKRIRPYEWGAPFNNPSTVGTGLLPQDYPQGQVKYVDLDLGAMTSKFLPN